MKEQHQRFYGRDTISRALTLVTVTMKNKADRDAGPDDGNDDDGDDGDKRRAREAAVSVAAVKGAGGERRFY